MPKKLAVVEGKSLVPAIGGCVLKRIANELVGRGLPYPDNESEPFVVSPENNSVLAGLPGRGGSIPSPRLTQGRH